MKKSLLSFAFIAFTMILLTSYGYPEIDQRDFDGDGDIDGDDLSVFAEKFGAVIWYKDFDGDHYSNGNTEYSVSQPTDFYLESELIATTGDCDDGNTNVNPGMDEICDDGLDNDCDGLFDQQDEECTGSGYTHSIVVDGSLDFDIEKEAFNTSTNGFNAYITWDEDFLFIGFEGSDIQIGDIYKWLLVYIGNGEVAGGTNTGLLYNTQQPNLPFLAKYQIRWQTSGAIPNTLEYNGASWVDAGWDFTGDFAHLDSFIELRIPLVDIGSPLNSLQLHLSMINENSTLEYTYAGVPFDSFSDNYDPDYTKYFEFDLTNPSAPNTYNSQ
jgi:hypothetical protein